MLALTAHRTLFIITEEILKRERDKDKEGEKRQVARE